MNIYILPSEAPRGVRTRIADIRDTSFNQYTNLDTLKTTFFKITTLQIAISALLILFLMVCEGIEISILVMILAEPVVVVRSLM